MAGFCYESSWMVEIFLRMVPYVSPMNCCMLDMTIHTIWQNRITMNRTKYREGVGTIRILI